MECWSVGPWRNVSPQAQPGWGRRSTHTMFPAYAHAQRLHITSSEECIRGGGGGSAVGLRPVTALLRGPQPHLRIGRRRRRHQRGVLPTPSCPRQVACASSRRNTASGCEGAEEFGRRPVASTSCVQPRSKQCLLYSTSTSTARHTRIVARAVVMFAWRLGSVCVARRGHVTAMMVVGRRSWPP